MKNLSYESNHEITLRDTNMKITYDTPSKISIKTQMQVVVLSFKRSENVFFLEHVFPISCFRANNCITK